MNVTIRKSNSCLKFLIIISLFILTLHLITYITQLKMISKPGDGKIPKILLWTQFFGKPWHGNPDQMWEIQCDSRSIQVYQKPDFINLSEMDAILFHLLDLDLSSVPQKSQNANQKWILFNLEAPSNLLNIISTMSSIQNKIDWVMNYRHDSDIFIPYGFVAKSDKTKIANKMFRVKVDNARNQRFVYGVYDAIRDNSYSSKLKRKQIAWIVSNCNSHSNRDLFVNELSKYIKVDIYGHCGSVKCPQQVDCKEFVGKEYNFYLSFENSLCKDYVTEKLFDALRLGIIPIVFGGANYTDILPLDSFIDALSFKSPKELADYLYLVSSNESLYSSYFSWRSNYQIFSTSTHVFHGDSYESWLCSVGDAILENRNSRNDRNLLKWFYIGSKCWKWINKKGN